MRKYVDAEKVLQEASRRFDYVDDFYEVLEALPAEKVREDITGTWLKRGENEYVCSNCGAGKYEYKQELLPRFCSHCGASMIKNGGDME